MFSLGFKADEKKIFKFLFEKPTWKILLTKTNPRVEQIDGELKNGIDLLLRVQILPKIQSFSSYIIPHAKENFPLLYAHQNKSISPSAAIFASLFPPSWQAAPTNRHYYNSSYTRTKTLNLYNIYIKINDFTFLILKRKENKLSRTNTH